MFEDEHSQFITRYIFKVWLCSQKGVRDRQCKNALAQKLINLLLIGIDKKLAFINLID